MIFRTDLNDYFNIHCLLVVFALAPNMEQSWFILHFIIEKEYLIGIVDFLINIPKEITH